MNPTKNLSKNAIKMLKTYLTIQIQTHTSIIVQTTKINSLSYMAL